MSVCSTLCPKPHHRLIDVGLYKPMFMISTYVQNRPIEWKQMARSNA